MDPGSLHAGLLIPVLLTLDDDAWGTRAAPAPVVASDAPAPPQPSA